MPLLVEKQSLISVEITPAEIQPYCYLHEALHDKRQLQHHCCNANVSSIFTSGKGPFGSPLHLTSVLSDHQLLSLGLEPQHIFSPS